MAHWAEVDDNNVVLRVVVGSNDEPDEGYQWLLDNLGGRWLKTSYNTQHGKHLTGGEPFRGNYAGIGFVYVEEADAFMPPKPYESWVVSKNFMWEAPVARPTEEGDWEWSESDRCWNRITSL